MKQKHRSKLTITAERILICLLTPIAAMLVITAFFYSSLDTYDAARLYPMLCSAMEHIMMSLLLAVGGSLLFDMELKRRG